MIIGIKERDNVVIGYANVELGSVYLREDSDNPENVGLWAVEGNPHTIMGCDVITPESDAFRYEGALFGGRLDYNSMVREVLPKTYQFRSERGYLSHAKARDSKYLVAQEDRLFLLHVKRFSVMCSDVLAWGYNNDLLYGSLDATAGLPAKDRILRAFKAEKAIMGNDAFNVVIMDTLTGRREVIWQR